MASLSSPKLFGSRAKTEVLVLLALLEESYPSELARLLTTGIYSIQTMVDDLDRQGVLTSRYVGRERRLALDPRFYAARELKALLLRLAEGTPHLRELAASRRSRPRRKSGLL